MMRWLRRLHSDDRGVGLVESLVSSALLGIALMVLMTSLSTFAVTSRNAEDRATGQALARAQVARIVAAPYQATGDYSAYDETLPTGFSRTIAVTWWDGTSAWTGTQNANGLQMMVLTIAVGGTGITSLEFAKSSR
jgi:type II secretory pathway pseudopilin PulG